MSDQNIEFSKEGIKISYLRFLSDSAAGQIVILIAVLAYYFPIFGPPLQQIMQQSRGSAVPTEVKVLVAVLLFLLSSPLGLAINATSWFALGWLQVGLQRCWFKGSRLARWPPLKHTHEEFHTALTREYFHLSPGNWYERSQLIKQTLHVYHPYITNSLDHVRGIRTFLRNISFLSVVFLVASLIFRRHDVTTIETILTILFVIIPTVVSSLLGFHYTSHVLYRTYILMLAAGDESDLRQNFNEKVVRTLSREAGPKRRETG